MNLAGSALVEAAASLGAVATRALIEQEERKYIKTHIQPWVERHYCNSKIHEAVESFQMHGSGLNRWLSWEISHGEECQGCDGSGRLFSHKGTRVDCPDCWGAGFQLTGEMRELVTDYDGETKS